jgi:glycosyltransferase involved in cell wall biosynthesis
MTIAFLNHSISRKAGGVFEIERRLAQCLLEIKNVNIEIFGAKDEGIEQDLQLWLPFQPKIYKIIGPRSFGFSPNLVYTLKRSNAQLLHLHVLWLYPSIASLRSNIPFITTINGMLDEWAIKNSSFKKKIAFTLYEKAALQKAGCLQANTIKEYNDIRKFGLKNPVCIIPNGVDLPEDIAHLKLKEPAWQKLINEDKKILLYLGRIHPKKGLSNLIKSWKKAIDKKTNGSNQWNLVIAGWDQEGYEQELKRLVKESGMEKSVHFIGPQFNETKELAFAHANAFVLPSFSEGLPMAVLEAWAYELPVLITPQCNLPEGYEYNAALLIEPAVESITDGLIKLFALSETELKKIGTKGKQLVIQKFNWNNVAEQMHRIYKWMLNEGDIPENVILE